MSQRFPGGFITKTPTAPTSSSAPGIWTLDQAMQNQKAGNWPSGFPTYIEDVFSTWLYTGNGSTQTITNGIDLAAKGGLVWEKQRTATGDHLLWDSSRGTYHLNTNNSDAQADNTIYAPTFNANGYTSNYGWSSSQSIASWTFAERQKFFDVVTYTGNGTAGRTIAHNLGSVPGMIIVKEYAGTSASTANWVVYHRSLGNTQYAYLNSTAAAGTVAFWNNTDPTATNFTIGSFGQVNETGGSFVAYLFAHDAGGFGLTGNDNVISCGSFTTDGSGNGSISLGYEPQWLLVKESSGTGNWSLLDNMRGLPAGSFTDALLSANLTTAEAATNVAKINATGASFTNYNPSATVIYIAIRRGPMAVPTTGTSVYTSASRTGTAGVMPRWVAGFPVDWALRKSDVTIGGGDWQAGDRLRGAVQVKPNLTEAETSASPLYIFDGMTGYSTLGAAGSDTADRSWMFRRAPSFFDEVCYTGTGSATTFSHNLGVAPEFIICKVRDAVNSWQTQVAPLGPTYGIPLNSTNAAFASTAYWNDTAPTSSVFTVGTSTLTNASGNKFVAYLFATCPGVSKVGSYTGTAALLTVNCGFTSGARFVLIKRTDSTGDWYVYDSARGISSGNDPYLLLNSTAAETTGTNYVDTDTTGFKVTAAAPAGLNASGGTYIFLAIA